MTPLVKIKATLAIPVLIAAGVVATFLPAAKQPDHRRRLESVGIFLAAESIAGHAPKLSGARNIPDVVVVGESLAQKLGSMQSALRKSYSCSIMEGDALDEDQGVTHTLFIATEPDAIGLRLRYDPSLDRYHVVGYFTVRK